MGFAFLVAVISLAALPDSQLLSADSDTPATLGKELRHAVREKDFPKASKLVAQLAEQRTPRAFREMLDHGILETVPELEVQIREVLWKALEEARADVAKFILRQCSKSRNYRARVFLLEIIGDWPVTSATLNVLHVAVGDSRTPVAFTAIRLIRKLKQEESIAPMIDHLSRLEETGRRSRLYFDIVDFLKAMTDKDLKTADDWKNWNTGGKKRAKKKRKKKRRRPRTVVKSDFFSIPVNSDRVLFVIDVSASMSVRDPEELPKKSGKTRTLTKEELEKPPEPPPLERERLARVKKELMAVIRSLPEKTRFSVVSFDHETTRWGGKNSLQKAEKKTKVEAIQWVAALQAKGATRTDRALESGLNLSDVDTIFLLTDGRPKDVSNRNLSVEAILERTKHVNRFRCCRINTISFSHVRDSEMRHFLTALAEQNDGRLHSLP